MSGWGKHLRRRMRGKRKHQDIPSEAVLLIALAMVIMICVALEFSH